MMARRKMLVMVYLDDMLCIGDDRFEYYFVEVVAQFGFANE
jgi:hypothetical protein